MFKFLTDVDGAEDDGRNSESRSTIQSEGSTTGQLEFVAASEVIITQEHYQLIAHKLVAYSTITLKGRINGDDTNVDKSIKERQIKYIQVPQLANMDNVAVDDKVKNILQSTSDLVAGVYEGGFKIWECTLDLIKYLESHLERYQFGKTCTVLDLGCGSGLLGLRALSYGSTVHFQDYNREVLDCLTIPNVLLNFGNSDDTVANCRFFSGDWTSVQHDIMIAERKNEFLYDFILSSETIYNTDNLPKLYGLVKHSLKPTGIMLLAAKTFYFGIGGSTKAFISFVESDGVMSSEIVHTVREGVHREIILLKFK